MKKTLSKGFTLVELAVALTIVAVVVGGLAIPLSKRLAEQQYADTQATLDKAVEALVGFAILNRRLPCPDVNTAAAGSPDNRDGVEDAAGGPCGGGTASGTVNYVNSTSAGSASSWGDLPWQTLGLSAPHNADAWNNRLRYAVVTTLAASTAGGATPLSGIGGASPIDIRCGNPANPSSYVAAPGCLPSLPGPSAGNFIVSSNAVFVVYSVGANGWGGTPITSLINKIFSASGLALTSDQAANAPELKGAAATRNQFVTRARTDASSKAGEFDDLLTFMSSNTLAAKLLNAGVWP
jgi:prepilin-type N-terminal cleavage/methylation domain-containing protein